jgi:L-2-hydroxyglutarate oxidase
MTPALDVVVVGGGIVGLSTARALVAARPGLGVRVLEKEDRVGAHQTGHNSGVLHSGLYYAPGSHKARLCVEGRREMLAYCDSQSIPVRVSGKLVIATRRADLEGLERLHRRGDANGLRGIERLGPQGIKDIEPRAVGLAALRVPETGVVDFAAVAGALGKTPGVDVRTGQPVEAIVATYGSVEVATRTDRHTARLVVNCAGLHADRVATMAGLEPDIRIVPFRGEYFTLAPPVAADIRALIYPVPDPRFPFLGVHLTRRLDEVVEVGPNAVLALGREHYRDTSPDWSEVVQILRYRGMQRLALRYWRAGIGEIARSRVRGLYARSVRRLVSGITAADLLPGGSGVRAQAVTARGRLADDFVFADGPRSLHVLNAPSPAATASLAIGRTIATRAIAALDAT